MSNRWSSGLVPAVFRGLSDAHTSQRRSACSGRADRRRRLPFLAFALGLLVALLSAPAFAQTVPTDYVTAKSVAAIGPSGGMYLGQGNFIANGKYIPAGYYKAPISYNPATIGKLAKGVLSKGLRLYAAYETVKALYDLANYLYNPSTGKTETGGQASMSCSSGYSYSSSFNNLVKTCGAASMWQYMQPTFKNTCYTSYQQYGGGYCVLDPPSDMSPGNHVGTWHWYTTDSRYPPTNNMTYSYSISLWGSPVTDPAFPGTEVSDTDMYNVVKDNPQMVHDLLHDSSGQIMRTAEVKQAEDTLGVALHDKYAVPTTVGDGGTAVDLGVPMPTTQTTTTPDTMPEFCSWASVVCDFITWYKTPPVVDQPLALPTKDPGIVQQTWSSGQGSGSCPAPVAVDVDFIGTSAPIEFSFQPLCDLAGLLHGLTIAASLLIAAYMISGTRNV